MNETERRAFLERRQKGIGGSDLGALVGVHPFGKTATDIFLEKTQPLPAVLPEPTGPQLRGIYLEPIIGQTYSQDHGVALLPGVSAALESKPYIMGNTDFTIPVDRGALEAKAPGLEMFAKLKQEGITAHYQLQAQQYYLILPLAYVDFRFLNAERWAHIDVRLYRDEKLGRDITAIQDQFWNDHVLKGIPPANDMFHIDLPAVEGGTVTITDPERLEAIQTLREAKELFKTADNMKSTATETLKLLLGATGTYEAPGDDEGLVHRIHFTQTEGKWEFDKDALIANGALDPHVVQAVLTETFADQPDRLKYLLSMLQPSRIDFTTQFRKKSFPYTALRTYFNAKKRK